MRRSYYGAAIMDFMYNTAPILMGVVGFSTYGLIYEDALTAEKAFVSLSIFNMLRLPLIIMPFLIKNFLQVIIAGSRCV